ncbi:MAG: hypothetical protein HRT47_12780 [Candidatus Caenarcaniphilales bacterium]|nr:hypothetical protein [Candidatus Caenarcaniphilales bacterium]
MNDGSVGSNNFNPDRGKPQIGGAKGTGKVDSNSNQKPLPAENIRSTKAGFGNNGTGVSPNVKLALMAMNPVNAAALANVPTKSLNVSTGHAVDMQIKALETGNGFEELVNQANSNTNVVPLKDKEQLDKAITELADSRSNISPYELKVAKSITDGYLKTGKTLPTTQNLVDLFNSGGSEPEAA